VAQTAVALPVHLPPPVAGKGRDLRLVILGAGLALCAHYVLQWLGHMPWWQRISRRFIWWRADAVPYNPYGAYAGAYSYWLVEWICFPALSPIFARQV